MEVSPGMAVHRVTDIALKASNVRLGQMVVERAFGSMALYHRDQSTVLHPEMWCWKRSGAPSISVLQPM